MIIQGYIQDVDDTHITIVAPFTDYQNLLRKQITECEIRLDDGRTISADQRKKIYATFRDISLWSGHDPDEVKILSKYDFIAKTGCRYFSLSDVDMTTAREFLQYLIEFCIELDVPCADILIERSPDISRYVYCCLVHKKCCITGLKSELHHVDAIGRGRNRKDIVHLGMRVLPLTRIMHTKAHSMGNTEFCKLYHIEPIKLDKYLCEIYKIRWEIQC